MISFKIGDRLELKEETDGNILDSMCQKCYLIRNLFFLKTNRLVSWLFN